MNPYVVADFFSGCGGFSLGFHKTGLFRTGLAVDQWSVALETMRSNISVEETLELDLSCRQARGLLSNCYEGAFDVVLGGPPCQGFSTLGKRRDGDLRSTLVDQFGQLAVRLRPKVIIVENVRGILTKRHPSGGTYASALRHVLTFNENCSYICSERLLNAIDFGVPQTRIRWFMFAVRKDLVGAGPATMAFWRSVEGGKCASTRVLRDAIGDLPSPNNQQPSQKISNHQAMQHSAALIERFQHVPPGGGLPDVPAGLLTPHLRKMLNGSYGSGGHVKNIYGRMEWDKPSGTIVAGIDKITCGRFVHPEEHRLLTPRECARVQSFPDTFKFAGGQVAQYYQIGNAVPPALAKALAVGAAEALSLLGPARARKKLAA